MPHLALGMLFSSSVLFAGFIMTRSNQIWCFGQHGHLVVQAYVSRTFEDTKPYIINTLAKRDNSLHMSASVQSFAVFKNNINLKFSV